jgi:hypothetical protein
LLRDLHHARKDQAELPRVSFDGVIDADCRLEHPRTHFAVFRTVDVPVAAYDIALDDAFRRRAVFTRLPESGEVERDKKLGHVNLFALVGWWANARESTAALMPNQVPGKVRNV